MEKMKTRKKHSFGITTCPICGSPLTLAVQRCPSCRSLLHPQHHYEEKRNKEIASQFLNGVPQVKIAKELKITKQRVSQIIKQELG